MGLQGRHFVMELLFTHHYFFYFFIFFIMMCFKRTYKHIKKHFKIISHLN